MKSSTLDFDREVAPITNESNLLLELLKKHAFDKENAVSMNNFQKEIDYDSLLKKNLIKMIYNNGSKIYLTIYGKLIASGEHVMQLKEKTN